MDIGIKNHGISCGVYIRNLYKSYDGGSPILRDLCVNVEQGKIYGLLGSSGSGKSTILSCIVGLTRWDSGELLVFGKEPGSRDSGIPGRRLGYMPQETALYNELSIKEIIHFYGTIYNMSSEKTNEKMDILNQFLQLPSARERVGTFSGGQKRRVSLALALIHSPDLLVLDEPTVGLDPLLRMRIWDYLNDLANTGTTIIVTTHYMEEASFANSIGLLRNGRLLVEDTPSRLLETYQKHVLGDIILDLCRQDELTTRMSPQDSENSYWKQTESVIMADTINSSTIIDISPNGEIEIDKQSTSTGIDLGASTNSLRQKRFNDDLRHPNEFIVSTRESLKRIRATSTLILTILTRYPIFFALVLIMPAVKAVLVILIIGSKPRGMAVGIVNHEIANWTKVCKNQRHLQDSCDLDLLSCKFLEHLKTGNIVVLESHDTEEDALIQIHRGNAIGYLSIPNNYSQHALELAVGKQFATNDSIEGSRIRAYLDNSHYVEADFTTSHLIRSYIDYVHNLILSCKLNGNNTSITPYLFRRPVYGNDEDNYVDYLLPGDIITGLMKITSTVTAIIIITGCKQGTVTRELVAGLKPLDMMISHLITQGIINIIQLILLKWILNCVYTYSVLGSLWQCFAICILTGLCAALLGIFLALVFGDEVEVFVFEIFITPFLLIFGGVAWSTDSIPKTAKYLGYILPTSMSTESLRSIIVRGWGITHPLVWPGVIVLIIWIFVLCICCVITYKVFYRN